MGWPQLLIIAVKPRFHYNIGTTTMHFLCVVPTLGFLPEASHNLRVSLSLTTTTHPRAVQLSSLSLLVRLSSPDRVRLILWCAIVPRVVRCLKPALPKADDFNANVMPNTNARTLNAMHTNSINEL